MAFVVFSDQRPYLFQEDWTSSWEPSQWLFDLRKDNVTPSRATQRDYAYCIGDFLTWCEQQAVKWYSASVADIERYFETFDVDPRSLNKRIMVVFDFFVWAVAREHVRVLPFVTKARAKTGRYRRVRRSGLWQRGHDFVPQLLKPFVGRGALLGLPSISEVWKFRDAFAEDRDKLIVEVLLFVGLRIDELLNLKCSIFENLHLDESNRSVFVSIVGKGAKERVVLFPRSLVHRIRGWIQLQRRFAARKESMGDQLFIGNRGTLSARAVQKAFEKISASLGLKIHPHILRHVFATHYLKYLQSISDPSPMEQLRELLGHASSETTQRYLILTDQERIRIAEEHGSFVAALANGSTMSELCQRSDAAVVNVARYELQHGFRRS